MLLRDFIHIRSTGGSGDCRWLRSFELRWNHHRTPPVFEGKLMETDFASGAALCPAAGEDARRLAWRMTQCLGRLDLIRIRMKRLELHGWQSPAGTSYRQALSRKQTELDSCAREVQSAASLVGRHAVVLAAASGRDGH